MAIVEISIPQMGEGLHEVCLLGFNKQPGDFVHRDEILYSMETDKAAMEVESPQEGVLKEWLAREGDILAVGAPVARMETDEAAVVEAAPAPSETSGVVIPPRTRAYCREKGVPDEEMRRIPAPTGKLMPADVDAYLKIKQDQEAEQGAADYVERPLSQQHRVFIFRLKRSAQLVVPAVAKRSMEWGSIRHFADACRERGLPVQPSAFQTFAYCVAQAAREHPRFRSTLIGEETIREFAHLNLGIAVAQPDGELATAVVRDADALDFDTFVRTAQQNIQRAREGENQVDDATQLHLTYLGPYEIVDAIPVLVAPAAAILFIGSAYPQNGELLVNLVLTIDHRLIQGIEAAQFLRTIVEKCAQVGQWA